MAPRSRKHTASYFNVMVVGFAGVGKTSFVRTLIEALMLEEHERQQEKEYTKKRRDSVMSETSFVNLEPEGPIEKTLQPYTVSREIIVDRERVLLTMIDTPGFQAEYLVDKQLHDIIKYVEHQFDLTLAEESKVKRNPKAVDTQVHCCLYFLDPKKAALDEYDIRILTKLSKRVNVIPVIGKADQLTLAQKNRLKPRIVQDIYNKIPIYGMPTQIEEDEDEDEIKSTKEPENLRDFIQQYTYEEEDFDTQVVLDYLKLIPFTFISYEDEPTTGKPLEIPNVTLGRNYGWGTIDCLNDLYSDFTQLKRILLSTHRSFLQLDTVERYYEQYRTEKLTFKRATKLKSMDLSSKKILKDLNNL
ncbi:Septin-type guanine nucleotide-binding (G) domain-containing protein [Sporodiniella umbellata]|nr:Septin-type guanine nucleotide-binding (G) domain-containing protein [Sporodiniella umbellata]